MIKSFKASHSHATEMRKGCRKRDGEGPSESRSRPLKYGYVSILGRRRVMEDSVIVMPPRRLPCGYSFFAAHGCGGPKLVETCTDKLHQCLEKRMAEAVEEEGLAWDKLVMDCFTSMYEDWGGLLKFTAVLDLPDKDEMLLVNCGGSRALLWTGGVALPLWTQADEADERVEALIMSDGECVRGSAPEVRVMRRNGDSFLIIANDGLWNVVEKHTACEVVRECLAGKIKSWPSEGGDGVSHAAAMLAELAIAKGSKDNITIVLLHLN
ncbi:probable protein phosphatase 2C 8 [Salvia miltiorrhiza]|uniref:probable protein phosphatase 2C 8 n=1 Tax=Salvia miltiorrhiza TaxID=226208 RepID=UPI0025ACFA80|nr:probable protein phosphatase 2C 8 [Salvia miltiorrhiza]